MALAESYDIRTVGAAAAVVLALHLLIPSIAACQWPDDPSVNLPICTAEHSQNDHECCGDSEGGAIIVWKDTRNVGYNQIYAQRVSVEGVLQWTYDGFPVSPTEYNQYYEDIAPDSQGGALVAWEDLRTVDLSGNDIYAQRIGHDGELLWGAAGVAVCIADERQEHPAVAGDGLGGAFFAWADERDDAVTQRDIYVQYVDADGVVQWAADGVPVCTETWDQRDAELVTDGAGGIIVAWTDLRASGAGEIYAQRVSEAGNILWAPGGMPVCTADDQQDDLYITADGAGGAILTWGDARNMETTWFDIYAQRIDEDGLPLWDLNGVPVCDAPNAQSYHHAVSDGQGGLLVAWWDARNWDLSGWDVYAQHLDPDGVSLWTEDGVAVCEEEHTQEKPRISPDGSGGAVVSWFDDRDFTVDLYAQRIGAGGGHQWTADGVVVCVAEPTNQYRSRLVSDQEGGAIISWIDLRDFETSSWDVYVQRIHGDGSLGDSTGVAERSRPAAWRLAQNHPNPFNPETRISFFAPEPATVRLAVYDLRGVLVDELAAGFYPAGEHALRWAPGPRASGIYLLRLEGAGVAITRKMMLLR